MSYIATEIEKLLAARGLSPADLSKASGINESKISRWRRGDQPYVSPEDHEALARVLCKNAEERAWLLVAQLRDILVGSGSELVEISVNDQPVLRDAPHAYGTKLPPDLERDFATLRSAVMHDKQLRNIVESIAKMFRPKPTKD